VAQRDDDQVSRPGVARAERRLRRAFDHLVRIPHPADQPRTAAPAQRQTPHRFFAGRQGDNRLAGTETGDGARGHARLRVGDDGPGVQMIGQHAGRAGDGIRDVLPGRSGQKPVIREAAFGG